MEIRLRRAISLDTMRETQCALCGDRFEVEAVFGEATCDDSYLIGEVCDDCVEFFGRRNPKRFPTWIDLKLLKGDHPELIFATSDEAAQAQEEDPFKCFAC